MAGCTVADMSARFLSLWPCQDACGTIKTDEVVEGAPVYRCPGCDTTWIELYERGTIAEPAVEPDNADDAEGPAGV